MASFEARKSVTIQKARGVAEGKGGRITTATWLANTDLIQVVCRCAHQWRSTAYRILQGDWCPACATFSRAERKRERTMEAFRHHLAAQGATLLSPTYERGNQCLEVRCNRGHTYAVNPVDAVYRGVRCPLCMTQDRQKNKIEEQQQTQQSKGRTQDLTRGSTEKSLMLEAESKGLTLRGVDYRTKHSYVRLGCLVHGDFRLRTDQFRAGKGCPLCSFQARSAAHREDILARAGALASSRGGKVLSPTFEESPAKLQWQCREGHRWLASPSAVLGTHKTWCPDCARKLQASLRLPKSPVTRRSGLLGQARRIAAERGGACLDEVYESSARGLRFRCSRGHEFSMSFRKLRYQWCDHCSKTRHSRGEAVTRTILEQYLRLALPPGRPEWLLSDKGRRMSLDGYSSEAKIAFEYQGEGVHKSYRTTGRYNDQTKLKRTQELDRQKVELCRQAGVSLLVIDGFGARIGRATVEATLREVIQKAGLVFDPGVPIDWGQARFGDDNLKERIEVAFAPNGLRLVTATILNVFSPIEVECPTHRIRWQTTPTAVIHRGRLCPVCTGGRARKGQRPIVSGGEGGQSMADHGEP